MGYSQYAKYTKEEFVNLQLSLRSQKNTCEKMGTIGKFHPLNFTVVTDSLDQQSSVDTNNLMN